MDNIHAEEQWDVQTTLLHGNALHLLNFFYSFQVKQSTDLATFYLRSHIATLSLTCHDFTCHREVELSQFFL